MDLFLIQNHVLNCRYCSAFVWCPTLEKAIKRETYDCNDQEYTSWYDHDYDDDYDSLNDYSDGVDYDDGLYGYDPLGEQQLIYADWGHEQDLIYAEQTQMFLSRSKAFRHTRPAKDKDKARWAKKKFAHLKKEKRVMSCLPLSNWRKTKQFINTFHAIEEQHSRFPMHTKEGD